MEMVLMMFSFQMQNIIAENLTTQKTSMLESNRYRKNVDNVLSGVHENAFILLIFMTSKRKKRKVLSQGRLLYFRHTVVKFFNLQKYVILILFCKILWVSYKSFIFILYLDDNEKTINS